jgi:coproporphyrinogen III oxidase-like Fe-S oxidoreductase
VIFNPQWLRARSQLQQRYAEVSRVPDASRLAYLRGPAHTVTEEMIADLWRSAIDNPALPTATVNSIYIHVPFCKSICSFCNYERLQPSNPDFLRAFLDRIKRSISVLGPAVKGLNWGAVYVGGGTPSTLPAAMLDELFTCLNQYFEIHPDAERSFELDPAVISGARLDVLKAHGFGHFSFGIQSLSADVNRAHNRGPQGRKTIERCFEMLFERELYDVACDFLLGLDGTSPSGILSDIEWVLERFAPRWVDVFQIAPTPEYVNEHFGGEIERYWAHLKPFQDAVPNGFQQLAKRRDYRVDTGGGHRYTLHRAFVPPGRPPIPRRPHGYNQLVSEAKRPMHLLGLGPSARSQIFGQAAFKCRDPGDTPIAHGPAVYTGHRIDLADEIRAFLVHHWRDGDVLNRAEFSRIFGADVLDAIPVAAAAWSDQELTQTNPGEFRLNAQTRAERTRSLMWLVPDEHLEYEIARRQQLDTTGAGVEWLGEALALGTPLTGQCQYGGVWEGRVIILTGSMARMVFRVAPGLEEHAELRLVLESAPPKDAMERTALTRAMRQVRGVFRLAQSGRVHST